MSLTDFLLARIAEDKAWTLRYGSLHARVVPGPQPPTDATRILLECDTKRLIVEHYDAAATAAAAIALLPVLHLLAVTYADHSDYRDEWKP